MVRRNSQDQGKKLEAISAKLQRAEEQATKERCTMRMEQELVLLKGERIVHKECESLRRQLYNQRSQIIKSIPCFWLTAFLSHYALHHLLSGEDQKIFRFLNSVNVKRLKTLKVSYLGIQLRW
ncbi:NAP1-related protein 2-like [Papaver somniferum]|uniref:NAP1-related protein 2-like n=1 Tax=Papaver somniferum TaxID=3469 RepID=UPI000E7022C4|nr:NAP1-related protein 2-like [Papaver somniferum]